MTEALTPPEGLRLAADLLDRWSNSKGTDITAIFESYLEIAAVHDTITEHINSKPELKGIIQERQVQLRKLLSVLEQ